MVFQRFHYYRGNSQGAEVAIKFCEGPIAEVCLTVLKTLKGLVYSFTKLIAADHE